MMLLKGGYVRRGWKNDDIVDIIVPEECQFFLKGG